MKRPPTCWVVTGVRRAAHRFLVVDRKYSPGHRHGRMALADALPPSDGPWPHLPLLAGGRCGANLLFVDLETTGLGGGAGTYAFLVGCAWFDGGTFRVRQFFLSSYSAERAMLEAVGSLAGRTDTVVTYNGKSFDLPLIETRFLLSPHRRRHSTACRTSTCCTRRGGCGGQTPRHRRGNGERPPPAANRWPNVRVPVR